jgi:hypothetical protein
LGLLMDDSDVVLKVQAHAAQTKKRIRTICAF